MLFNSVLKYLGDAYPDYAASVLAGNDFIRSSFGAGFPLFASASYYILCVSWQVRLWDFCLFHSSLFHLLYTFMGENLEGEQRSMP